MGDSYAIQLASGLWLCPSGQVLGTASGGGGGGGGGTDPVAPYIGVDYSTADTPEPWYFTDWEAVRMYRFSYYSGVLTRFPDTKYLGVTDAANFSTTGGSAAAATLRSNLETFYYGSGSAGRADIIYTFAPQNETDKNYQSGTLPTALINTYAACQAVVHELNGDGSRRYPNARLTVDMTINNITNFASGPRFKAIAPYLDEVSSSLYPPGRQADPPVFNAPSYLDPFLAMVADWSTSYPNIKEVSCWEIGSPIDHTGDNGEPNVGGTTDWTKRPGYHASLIDYLYTGVNALGLNYRAHIYWNRQDNPLIPNQLKHDRYPDAQTTTAYDTVTAIHDWTP
ncbi:MAG: hypothetical protein H6515_14210 [Microthrixaceae bacterium]|nr:hypothetical protein [Microthrixaceae bacterium]